MTPLPLERVRPPRDAEADPEVQARGQEGDTEDHHRPGQGQAGLQDFRGWQAAQTYTGLPQGVLQQSHSGSRRCLSPRFEINCLWHTFEEMIAARRRFAFCWRPGQASLRCR